MSLTNASRAAEVLIAQAYIEPSNSVSRKFQVDLPLSYQHVTAVFMNTSWTSLTLNDIVGTAYNFNTLQSHTRGIQQAAMNGFGGNTPCSVVKLLGYSNSTTETLIIVEQPGTIVPDFRAGMMATVTSIRLRPVIMAMQFSITQSTTPGKISVYGYP